MLTTTALRMRGVGGHKEQSQLWTPGPGYVAFKVMPLGSPSIFYYIVFLYQIDNLK